LQQAATMRESKMAKKGIPKPKPSIIKSNSRMLRKVARKATPPQPPIFKKTPLKKNNPPSTRSVVRRSARAQKPKKRS
jgi:hypothetical protein